MPHHLGEWEKRVRKLCFLSGLPRSGSTLLAALLRQNPRVHAHMSSPLSGMLDVMVAEMSASEFAEFIDDERRWNVLRGVWRATTPTCSRMSCSIPAAHGAGAWRC